MNLKDKSGLKPSPLGPIPEDWEVVRLGDCTLPTEQVDPSDREHFWYIDISSIDNTICKIVNPQQIWGNFAPSRAKKLVRANDVIFSTTRPYLKNIAIVPMELDGQICSTGFCVLRANKERVLPEWIYYNVITERFIRRIESKMRGATYPAVTDKDVYFEKIPLPPLPEQKRIAEVLRTVDEAIEKVDQEMEHTERLKRGLMQHLLTRGIGHTRFKDSPLGKIPETWEVVRLKELTLKMFGGGTPSTNKKEYWDGDIPWITSAHIDGMYIQDGQRYISQEGVEHSSTSIVPAGNIIVATRVGIGKVAIAKIDVAISQDLTGMIVNRDRAIPEFLYWLLSFNHFGLKRFAQGSTIKGVLRSTIANMHLPLPPLPEQRKIAEILMTVDRKLELLRREKEHLQRLKRGLMDDLLTGRRRLRVEGQSSRSPLMPEFHHTPPSPSTGEGRGGGEENERS